MASRSAALPLARIDLWRRTRPTPAPACLHPPLACRWSGRAAPASRLSSHACPPPPTPSPPPAPASRHAREGGGSLRGNASAATLDSPCLCSCRRSPSLRRMHAPILQGDASLLAALAAEVLLPGLRVGLPEDLAAEPAPGAAAPGTGSKQAAPAGGAPGTEGGRQSVGRPRERPDDLIPALLRWVQSDPRQIKDQVFGEAAVALWCLRACAPGLLCGWLGRTALCCTIPHPPKCTPPPCHPPPL